MVMQCLYGILKHYKNGKKKLKAGTLEILKGDRGNAVKKTIGIDMVKKRNKRNQSVTEWYLRNSCLNCCNLDFSSSKLDFNLFGKLMLINQME